MLCSPQPTVSSRQTPAWLHRGAGQRCVAPLSRPRRLCGFEPFFDPRGDQYMYSRILTCDYEFVSPWWDEVSLNAKDLVSEPGLGLRAAEQEAFRSTPPKVTKPGALDKRSLFVGLKLITGQKIDCLGPPEETDGLPGSGASLGHRESCEICSYGQHSEETAGIQCQAETEGKVRKPC